MYSDHDPIYKYLVLFHQYNLIRHLAYYPASESTLELIGGSGGAPRKVRPQVAFIWLFRTQYGYLTGTNDVYMGINSHICIQIVPPKLVGGFRGAKPPESTFAPPYKFKRSQSTDLYSPDLGRQNEELLTF